MPRIVDVRLRPESIRKATTIALSVVTDSLLEYHICKGDTLILELGASPQPGNIVLMGYDENATFEVYWSQPFEDVKAVATGMVRRF